MSEEQEKKLDQLLEAVAHKYAAKAPEELPRLIEEAIEREKPRPLYRAWQPAFALLVVGLSAGLMLNKMRREGLAPEIPLPEPTVTKPQTRAPDLGRDDKEVSQNKIKEMTGRSRPVTASEWAESMPPEALKAPSVRVRTRLTIEETGFSGPEIRDGQGAKPYLIGEQAPEASSARAEPQAFGVKKAVDPPSYDEFMSNAGRYFQAGNMEGGLVYWNAALGLMPSETDPLPRASDLRRCRALLTLDKVDPVLRFLKELEKREARSVSPEEVKLWISLLEKGETQAVNAELKKILHSEPQP